MAMTSWRDSAAPIIAEVIQRVGKSDMKALRRALRDAYPFGQRKYWPYKAWCSEVQRQLGHHVVACPVVNARQADLFEEKPCQP